MAGRLASTARAGLIVLSLLGSSGCLGTGVTRFVGEDDWAGKYPGQAVAFDVRAFTSDWEEGHAGEGILMPLLAIFSLPVDIAVDVLLSPVDLILWPLGFEKLPPEAPDDGATPAEESSADESS